jgi:DNA repair protein RecO (recombination protein O)
VPSYQTTGIVIGRTNFGEADRIIRLLTPEHGKISAVAKGVRKIKSRLGGHLELFGEVGLMLATGRNLDIITSARLSWYPHQLATQYAQLELAYLFGRLIDRVAQERQAQPELYTHLSQALRATDAGATGPLLQLWFKLRVLQLAGYRPELTACLVCGRHDAGTAYFFDASRGGIVCASDSSAVAAPISTETIKLWRLLSDYPYATIAHISNGPQLAAASLVLCDTFYEHHLGQAFNQK